MRLKFHPFHSRTKAGVGNNLPRAVAHELGLPSRNLPARRMLPESDDKDVTRGIIKIYDIYLRKAVRKRIT